MSSDNKTSQPAKKYDCNIEKTIPRYRLFQEEIFSLVSIVNKAPRKWLDTGCGTGILVSRARPLFSETDFVLADPSKAMLDVAREKFSGEPCSISGFIEAGTEDVKFPAESFDIITAILAHHYLGEAARARVTANCFNMLKKGGLYITFETTRPDTEKGTAIGLERWRMAQISNGKSAEAAAKHISRFGTELSPITVAAQLALLRYTGFFAAELFWKSGMQAGFYAIK